MFVRKVVTLCRAATQPPEGQNMISNAFVNTGCLQMNGAVSKGNKEFISHLSPFVRLGFKTPRQNENPRIINRPPQKKSLIIF